MGGPSIYEWLRNQYLEIFASISKENFDIDQIIHQHLQKQGFYFFTQGFYKNLLHILSKTEMGTVLPPRGRILS